MFRAQLSRYAKPVWKMVLEAAKELPQPFAPSDVVRKIHQVHPEVKASTIRAHCIALSPDHPSYKHMSMKYRYLDYLGNGRYRLKKQLVDNLDAPPPERAELGDEDLVLDSDDEEVAEEALEFSFSFEADLQDHLARHLGDLEEGLILYDEGGVVGREYSTEVGRIDLLAVDSNGDLVVIELKRKGSDRSTRQLLRYMGWVKHNLAKGRGVRGFIVTREADQRLRYAASVLPSVKIKEYEVSFRFKDAEIE